MNDPKSIQIKLTILRFNYWEHFKRFKEIALILPIGNAERDELEKITNDLSEKMRDVEKKLPKKNQTASKK